MKDLKFNEGEDPADDKERIHYSTDGKGRWWKTVYVRQCPEGVFMQGRCQGVEGHKGVHWRFSPEGSFHYDDNDNDSSENGCSGSIPPEHKNYRTPMEMAKHFHREHRVHEEVKDPAEILRLENDETTDNESIDRPLDLKRLPPEKAAELVKRIEEYDSYPKSEKPKIE